MCEEPKLVLSYVSALDKGLQQRHIFEELCLKKCLEKGQMYRTFQQDSASS
jgi:hypothetical protein